MTDPTRSSSNLLGRVLGNPLVGLSPWIIFSLVEGKGRLELSAAVSLGTAIVILTLNWLNGSSPKMLEYADVVYFGALAIVVAVTGHDVHRWLELWGGEVANIALVVIVLGSILVRHPFTLAYAKSDTPKEIWNTPGFLKVNYQISWVWAIAFLIEAASGFYGDSVLKDSNNIWTGWIIQTLPLIIAAQFTIWYPNRLEALRDGKAEAEVPTVKEFLATITPWISIIGVITLAVGGAPTWFGVALIVVGLSLTRALGGNDDKAKGQSPTS